MKNKIIIANLKNDMLINNVIAYLNEVKKLNENIVICPSDIHIPYFLKNNYQVGIQNVSTYLCTGDVTPKQAANIGTKYALVGHSDRRIKYNETDADINLKVIECLKNNLSVILCVGETKEERDLLKMDRVLKRQIINALKNISNLNNIYIAYEPIWAIGTKKIPKINDIEKTITYIKQIIRTFKNKDIKVIYGGSVDENNIIDLNKIDNLDGFLIGKSSLEVIKFLNIIEVALFK